MQPTFHPVSYFWFFPLLGALLLSACHSSDDIGQMPPGTTRSEYRNATLQVVDEEPQWVFDMRNRLVWQRCSVGQHFENGRCLGKATQLTYDQAHQAMRRFNATSPSEHQWRLPTVFEAATLLHCLGDAYFEVPKAGLVCCPTKRWETEFNRCEISDDMAGQTWLREDIFPDDEGILMTSDINAQDSNGSGGLVFFFSPVAPAAYGFRSEYRMNDAPVRLVRSPNLTDNFMETPLNYPNVPD